MCSANWVLSTINIWKINLKLLGHGFCYGQILQMKCLLKDYPHILVSVKVQCQCCLIRKIFSLFVYTCSGAFQCLFSEISVALKNYFTISCTWFSKCCFEVFNFALKSTDNVLICINMINFISLTVNALTLHWYWYVWINLKQ